MRLLIVEDNIDILANLYAYLEPRGFVVDSATNGYAGFSLVAQNSYDVIVLDITLPGLDGLQCCQKIRNELKNVVPILLLTARDTVSDKVAGFDSGADDYLVKPFSLIEVESRLKALIRRARVNTVPNNLMQFGDLSFDTARYRAERSGHGLTLTKTGFKLLACLMRSAPNVVRRETLEVEVWGDNRPDSDALRTHMHVLRQAIDKPFSQAMLRTVQGIGYQLVTPDG